MLTHVDVVEHLRRFDRKPFEFRSDLDSDGRPTIICHHSGDPSIPMPVEEAAGVANEVRKFNPDRADQILECVEQARHFSKSFR